MELTLTVGHVIPRSLPHTVKNHKRLKCRKRLWYMHHDWLSSLESNRCFMSRVSIFCPGKWRKRIANNNDRHNFMRIINHKSLRDLLLVQSSMWIISFYIVTNANVNNEVFIVYVTPSEQSLSKTVVLLTHITPQHRKCDGWNTTCEVRCVRYTFDVVVWCVCAAPLTVTMTVISTSLQHSMPCALPNFNYSLWTGTTCPLQRVCLVPHGPLDVGACSSPVISKILCPQHMITVHSTTSP